MGIHIVKTPRDRNIRGNFLEYSAEKENDPPLSLVGKSAVIVLVFW